MRKFYFISVFVSVLAYLLLSTTLCGCNGCDNNVEGKTDNSCTEGEIIIDTSIIEEETYIICDEKDVAPQSVCIYLDNSKSMEGYVEGNNATFIAAISDLQSLNNGNGKLFFWGDKEPFSCGMNLAGDLKKSNKFNGGTTDLPEILGEMSKQANNGHLSFFVTDGMPSPKNTDLLESSETSIKNAIANSLKGKQNIAVAIFRKTSGYSGTYYDYKNHPHTLKNVVERPFFVIAIGKRDEVQWLMNQMAKPNSTVCKSYQDENTIYITFGLHKHNPALKFTGKQCFTMDKGKMKLKNKSGEVKLYANLPHCLIQDLGEKYIKDNLSVALNEKTDGNLSCVVEGTQITLTYADVRQLKDKETNITVKLDKGQQLAEWYKYSTNDDTKIEKNSAQLTNTFFLQALLDGIYEATEASEPYLIDTKITFSK